MRYYLFLIAILIPLAGLAQQDSLDVLARSSHFDGAIEGSVQSFYTESPSAMLYRSNYSLTKLNTRFDMREQDRVLLQQLGDGSISGGVQASSYLRMNDKSALWAKAHYKRGETHNVNWNSTADYLLLYPHILADSVGGDLTNEEYAFGGGYALRMGRINFALEGDYRASQEYRQIDPRPHNVVSDLTIKLSAGLEFDKYAVGVDFRTRLYKQDQEIKFYDPAGANTAIFFMTGLGSYYARYSGMMNSLVAYEGTGYTVATHIIPIAKKGWYARFGYNRFNSERLYRPNNSIPVSELISQQLTASTAYRANRWSVRAGVGYELRQGIEMVADRTGQGAIVDEQTMYNNNIYKADLEATIEWQTAELTYILQPRAEFWHTASTYEYPSRSMTLSQMGGEVRGGIEQLTERWRMKAFVGVGYYTSPDEELLLSGLKQPIAKQLTNTAERISQSVTICELSLGVERLFDKGLVGFLETGFRPFFYSKDDVEYQWRVNCGIKF